MLDLMAMVTVVSDIRTDFGYCAEDSSTITRWQTKRGEDLVPLALPIDGDPFDGADPMHSELEFTESIDRALDLSPKSF